MECKSSPAYALIVFIGDACVVVGDDGVDGSAAGNAEFEGDGEGTGEGAGEAAEDRLETFSARGVAEVVIHPSPPFCIVSFVSADPAGHPEEASTVSTTAP